MRLINTVLKLLLAVLLLGINTTSVFAQADKPLSKTKTTKSAPVMIESQVKGSQEQPNVIYVMPWQGISQPVVIQDSRYDVVLPKFKPINPKTFRQQLNQYYQQQTLNHNNKDQD